MRGSMRALVVAVAPLTVVASVTAVGASGYSVRVHASSAVATGDRFTVKARGVAERKALLYVYLDRKRCRSTWNREAQRVNILTFKSGQSYFPPHRRDPGAQPKPEAFAYAWVTGSFEKSFAAFAGTTAEREHVCVYLTTPNSHGGYQITAAHGSTGYAVTRSG